MDLHKVLHNISHIKWLFILWMFIILLYIFFGEPDNKITLTGSAIFLAGIFLGLESLSNIDKMNQKEKRLLASSKYVKRQSILYLIIICFLAFMGILFISLRFILPVFDPLLLEQFSQLGFDCFAMMLGFLCILKQLGEKVSYINNMNEEFE